MSDKTREQAEDSLRELRRVFRDGQKLIAEMEQYARQEKRGNWKILIFWGVVALGIVYSLVSKTGIFPMGN